VIAVPSPPWGEGQGEGRAKVTKIYTKTGDKGTTQLLSVGRVPKNHLRLQAYGEIDELNSVIGLARAQGLSPPLDPWLLGIQNTLFVLSSEIAVPKPDEINMPIPKLQASDTAELEKMIDELDGSLDPLKNFILPGGTPGAAQLHVARTVCRRAERALQTLHQSETLSPDALTYINRLSDLLFTMARFENRKRGVSDTAWSSR
jgi:cob(I)alamin adenosyltransferase